jgi:molybdate transport system ATP-binding protein
MRNVDVTYGEIAILRNVNWTIRAGESWALLGPNGSGKTTLLSLISGDHPQAYANDIAVFGRRHGEGEAVQDLKKQIGWVSPELQVYFLDSCTCLETVESGFQETIGLYEKVTPAQGRAARKWLKRFGLTSFAEAPLFELSAGLQRTVLLARALVKRPKLLILDEPCQGLDLAHQEHFLEMLDSILRSGKETAVYVTHRPEEIPSSIRRVLRLKNGRAHPAG